jgi:hypothetical protein
MKLQTVVPIPTPDFKISHSDKILSIGSCFAQNMATSFLDRKFQIISNPFGIIYNPLSISNGLGILLSKKDFQQTDLFHYNEQWHSFDHHSSFSNADFAAALSNIQEKINRGHQQLITSNLLILTLGTAYVYFEQPHQRPVANCHKLPANHFDKQLISVETTINALKNALQAIQAQNSSLQTIITISPIRHIRDGFVENQQSKATLILTVKQLIEELDKIYYFPSYEIVLDELRDYRFYNTDMVHLSDTALEYVWQKFENTFFEQTTLKTNQQFLKLKKAMQHRPFNPQSKQHQQFLAHQLEIIKKLEVQYPNLDFSTEKAYFGQ